MIKAELPRLILISLAGGILGAWLLLKTPESVFREAIPWLLLFATVLFIFGRALNRALKKRAGHHRHALSIGSALLALMLLGVCLYGGFFNAGLGIITLSYLVLAGYSNINAMNGLKLLISSTVSLIAIALFEHSLSASISSKRAFCYPVFENRTTTAAHQMGGNGSEGAGFSFLARST